jgi:hypothetical protein
MTRREQLQEDYEDALFALLMDQVAETEGAELLAENERLKHDETVEISEELHKRCRRTIRDAFAKKQRRQTAQFTYRAINKVAVVALVCILLFTSVYAAFPSVRISTLNLLIEISDVATNFTFSDENSPSSRNIDNGNTMPDTQFPFGYRLSDIPDGYEISYEGSDSKSVWFEYTNQDGIKIYLNIESFRATGIYNIDTENAQSVENIEIHGFDGKLIEKNEKTSVVWADTDNYVLIEIICTGLDKFEVLELANEVVFVGK